MERGAQALIKALGAAMVFGGLMLAFHPAYRGAVKALWRGKPAESPVWEANKDYYPMLGLTPGATHADSE